MPGVQDRLRGYSETAGVGAERIKALSFDAATHTAVLLGEQKQVLRRAILWTDQRSKEEVQELKDTCLDTIMDQAVNAPPRSGRCLS